MRWALRGTSAALPLVTGAMLVGCLPAAYPDFWALYDPDRDGHAAPEDCAPDDPFVYPGSVEDCDNGLDDNCDGFTDDWDRDCGVVWPGEDWVQVSAGDQHTCGRRGDGTMGCLGALDLVGEDFPIGATFESIDSGYDGVCGILDGAQELLCVGGWHVGFETFAGAGLFVQVTRGGTQVCALDEGGTPHCWPLGGGPVQGPPAGERFVSISAGEVTTCGVREGSRDIVCWPDHSFAADAPDDVLFDQISLGYQHACGLTLDRKVRCWSCSVDLGQCEAPTDGGYVQVTAGYSQSCAVHDTGRLECWGCELGDLSKYFDSGECESEGRSPVLQVSAGTEDMGGHTCAIQERLDAVGSRRSRILCWGSNQSGQSWAE